MVAQDILTWLETAPPFEAPTMGGVYRAAYQNFSGLDTGGYDLGWTFEVEGAGYAAVPSPKGGYHLAKVK